MRGGSKKPTAADKGKAVMPEKKRKTKDEKDREAAINDALGADLQESDRGGLTFHEHGESPVPGTTAITSDSTAAQTHQSRKRARADVDPVPSLPHSSLSIGDENSHSKFVSEARCSVVTVQTSLNSAFRHKTLYRTGFILISEEKYCLVLTCYTGKGDSVEKYSVYFQEEKDKIEAELLVSAKNMFSILLIPQAMKKYSAVTLTNDSIGYGDVYTLGALSGTKLNAKVKAPVIEELEGVLGIYYGKVTVPCCDATNYRCKKVNGAEKYFQLTCQLHDDIITLKNVDKEQRKADIICSAPVFGFDGKAAIGMIHSAGVWGDMKNGILAKHIVSCFKRENIGLDAWMEELKEKAIKCLRGVDMPL